MDSSEMFAYVGYIPRARQEKRNAYLRALKGFVSKIAEIGGEIALASALLFAGWCMLVGFWAVLGF